MKNLVKKSIVLASVLLGNWSMTILSQKDIVTPVELTAPPSPVMKEAPPVEQDTVQEETIVEMMPQATESTSVADVTSQLPQTPEATSSTEQPSTMPQEQLQEQPVIPQQPIRESEEKNMVGEDEIALKVNELSEMLTHKKIQSMEQSTRQSVKEKLNTTVRSILQQH